VDDDLGRARVGDDHQESQGRGEHGRERDRADNRLGAPPPLVQEEHARGGYQGQEDRDDAHVPVEHLEQPRHALIPSPSTWSVPVMPRAARSTTRKRAVMEKLMTMDVSTSDCGTGSAKV